MSAGRALALFVREDVRDTVRERQLQLLVAIFALLGLLVTYAADQSASATSGSGPELIPAVLPLFALLVPLLVLGFFASALVEKRTTGSLKILLGLPFSRRTVVVGTFLGRSLVVCAALFASLFASAALAVILGVTVDADRFTTVALVLALLAVTFTAIAVGISAVVRTTTRATVAAFGAFVLFFFGL